MVDLTNMVPTEVQAYLQDKFGRRIIIQDSNHWPENVRKDAAVILAQKLQFNYCGLSYIEDDWDKLCISISELTVYDHCRAMGNETYLSVNIDRIVNNIDRVVNE